MLSALNGPLRRVPGWSAYLLALLPFGWLVWQIATSDLGADPVKEVEHRLGKVALWLLMLGLAITPLRRFTGLNLLRYRRALGLMAVFYLGLHVAAWFVLDMGLLWRQSLTDLVRRPYLIFGAVAFAALIPLALTSSNASIRRLGRNWRRLHWLVYPAVSLGVIHYLWQMKVISLEGWLWLAGLFLLLLARFPRFSAR